MGAAKEGRHGGRGRSVAEDPWPRGRGHRRRTPPYLAAWRGVKRSHAVGCRLCLSGPGFSAASTRAATPAAAAVAVAATPAAVAVAVAVPLTSLPVSEREPRSCESYPSNLEREPMSLQGVFYGFVLPAR